MWGDVGGGCSDVGVWMVIRKLEMGIGYSFRRSHNFRCGRVLRPTVALGFLGRILLGQLFLWWGVSDLDCWLCWGFVVDICVIMLDQNNFRRVRPLLPIRLISELFAVTILP